MADQEIELRPNKAIDSIWDCRITGKYGTASLNVPEMFVTPLAVKLGLFKDLTEVLKVTHKSDQITEFVDRITLDCYQVKNNKIDDWLNAFLDVSESDIMQSYADVIDDLSVTLDEIKNIKEKSIPAEFTYDKSLNKAKDKSINLVEIDKSMGKDTLKATFKLISEYIVQEEQEDIPYQSNLTDIILKHYNKLTKSSYYKNKTKSLLNYLKVGYSNE